MSAVDGLMNEARMILDELDDIHDRESALNKRKAEIQTELLRYAEANELTSFASDRLTCSVQEKTRAAYDPEKWDQIMAWAVETGNTIAVQRRLSDARIVEIATSGTPLPEGIRLEPYSLVAFRRK